MIGQEEVHKGLIKKAAVGNLSFVKVIVKYYTFRRYNQVDKHEKAMVERSGRLSNLSAQL
jgi:hypothetical protein